MKNGFTLAEVLITLAVIGVVATLTMPNLIGNYQNRVLMTQLQKTLNTVQNAAMRAMEDTAAENFLEITQSVSARKDFLKNYFDTVNICDDKSGQTSFNNCLAQTYTSFDKSNSASNYDVVSYAFGGTGGAYCGALTSGATVCIGGHGLWFDQPEGISGRKFVIDVNGVKPPNVTGKDLFMFYVYKNGKMNYNLHNPNSFGDNFDQEANGDYCTTSQVYVNYSNSICLPYIISHGWQFKF